MSVSSSQRLLSLWLCRLSTDRIAKLRERSREVSSPSPRHAPSSFRGASQRVRPKAGPTINSASEPGIQKQTQSKRLDSGSGPSGRPGMTERMRAPA